MVLHGNVRIFLLDLTCKLSKERRTSDAGHILETDFVTSVFHDLVNHSHIIFHSMDRRIGYGEGNLRNHACLLGIFHAEAKITVIIQTAE